MYGPLFISFGAVVIGALFTLSQGISCGSCSTQAFLWSCLLLVSFLGCLSKKRIWIFPLGVLSCWIMFLSFKQIPVANLFRKSSLVVSKGNLLQGSFCQAPHFLGLTMPWWSFMGASIVLVLTLYMLFQGLPYKKEYCHESK